MGSGLAGGRRGRRRRRDGRWGSHYIRRRCRRRRERTPPPAWRQWRSERRVPRRRDDRRPRETASSRTLPLFYGPSTSLPNRCALALQQDNTFRFRIVVPLSLPCRCTSCLVFCVPALSPGSLGRRTSWLILVIQYWDCLVLGTTNMLYGSNKPGGTAHNLPKT